MLRIVAVAAVVLLAACGAKEAPAADAAVMADSTAMDSTAHKMDTTAVDTAAKKM